MKKENRESLSKFNDFKDKDLTVTLLLWSSQITARK